MPRAANRIIKITRDGTMNSPSYGYFIAPDTFIQNGGGDPVSYRAWLYAMGFTKTLTKAAPPKPKIIYNNLPLAADHRDQECSGCHNYPNPVTRMKTDQGMKDVVKCRNCGKLMQPKKRPY